MALCEWLKETVYWPKYTPGARVDLLRVPALRILILTFLSLAARQGEYFGQLPTALPLLVIDIELFSALSHHRAFTSFLYTICLSLVLSNAACRYKHNLHNLLTLISTLTR